MSLIVTKDLGTNSSEQQSQLYTALGTPINNTQLRQAKTFWRIPRQSNTFGYPKLKMLEDDRSQRLALFDLFVCIGSGLKARGLACPSHTVGSSSYWGCLPFFWVDLSAWCLKFLTILGKVWRKCAVSWTEKQYKQWFEKLRVSKRWYKISRRKPLSWSRILALWKLKEGHLQIVVQTSDRTRSDPTGCSPRVNQMAEGKKLERLWVESSANEPPTCIATFSC